MRRRSARYDDWYFVILPWEQNKHIPTSTTKEWCEKNCDGRWARGHIFKIDQAMYFESESDRIKFILKFM